MSPIIPITQWSASKYKTFSQCKLRAQLQYGQKIPEPERPLPPGKTEHANDRGTRIHLEAELYVQDKGPLTPELTKFKPEFESLRQLYRDGMVSLEGEWAMDRDWNPVDWRGEWVAASEDMPVAQSGKRSKDPSLAPTKTAKALPKYGQDGDVIKVGKQVWIWVPAWLRLKLDAMVHLSETEAVIIDYKSGKRFGNEISHAEQTQLYQLVALLRYPKLEIVHTELWYLDVDELAASTFTRQQGLRFLQAFTKKGRSITECMDFPASPNVWSCKWCPYGSWGTGHCERGVKR